MVFNKRIKNIVLFSVIVMLVFFVKVWYGVSATVENHELRQRQGVRDSVFGEIEALAKENFYEGKNVTNLEGKKVGKFKSFMDYKMISDETSNQYALQKSARTGYYGIRYYNELPMIAVAPSVAGVGDVVKVEFSDKSWGFFVVGDLKDETDLIHPDGSVIEFIVDTPNIPKDVLKSGTFERIYEGYVERITKL